MAKARKSGRGRKKKNAAAVSKTPKNKAPVKGQSPASSNSETSPFKGYDNVVKEPKLFGSSLGEDDSLQEKKNNIFDKLLDKNGRSNLHCNIRTYSNKKKKKEDILEFQDCKNRDDVIQWLNDNRNVFDRLTQTQDCDVSDVDSQLDMPSVSQQNTRVKRTMKKRSPYKLRARSLDIKIKKNSQGGRSKRHSLAGDTPVLENYHIEESFTDEVVPVPVENGAIVIIDLMEDEYLDNIEREILHRDKKSGTGWDRIKDFNKTINSMKKQPKQLKVMLETSPKKGANLLNNNYPCYDHDVLENYFIENMERLLENNELNSENSSSNGRFSVKNGVQIGKNFVTILKKIVKNEGKDRLEEFQPLMDELKQIFVVSKECSTQTCNVQKRCKFVQTQRNVANVVTQTETKTAQAGVQTEEKQLGNKNIQTEMTQREHKNLQTENNTVCVEVQTEDFDGHVRTQICQQSTASSETASDILFADGEIREPNRVIDVEDVFDDDLDFNFDTEDILQQHSIKTENESLDKRKTLESVLVVSAESKAETSKGVKRLLSESPINLDTNRSKRPCAKFIQEDLSVAFSTCPDEEGGEVEEIKKDVDLSDESDDDKYFLKLMERNKKVSEETTKPTTSSEKPKETVPPHNSSYKLEDDLDYFKPYEKTPKKSRRSLFDSKNDKVEPSPNIFSDSLFESTVVANQTLTENNVDVIVKQVNRNSAVLENDADEEVRNILQAEDSKVNILENVILKRADSNNSVKCENVSDSDDTHLSDVDFVESTPQHKRRNFADQREESALDITLPPPLEFQDTEMENPPKLTEEKRNPPPLEFQDTEMEEPPKLTEAFRSPSPPRRPLADINKITSTPISQKPNSENFLSLSPISIIKPKLSPERVPQNKNKSFPKLNRENNRVMRPLEITQQHLKKFSPLTIVRRPHSQICKPNVTPKQKSILNYVRPSQEPRESHKSESFEGPGKRKPCIACTRLNREQVMAISSLTNKKLASYSTSFSPKVTHLIVSVNEKNCLKDHTIKFVSAVAAGIWVLSFGWIQECLLKNALVPEEPYEVFDVSGLPGPQQSRLMRTTVPLFKGFKIHAAPPFASTTQQEIENVVRLLGGKVVPSPEHLLDKYGYTCVIVTEASATQDFELYETWLEALKVVTVDIEWLSRSVGQYNHLSLRPFTLCSDDTIERLGYPAQLTANTTYSFSQQTFSSVPSST